MKKTVAVAAASLFVAAFAPQVGAAESRKVTEEYTIANGAFWGHGEAHWTLGAAYTKFVAARGERSVSLEIADASGQPVRGHVHIDLDSDGELDRQVDFCGATTKPISVRSGSVVEVGTLMGLCDENTPSIVTEGTITATFAK